MILPTNAKRAREIAKVLDRSARKIEKHGWIRRVYGNDEIGYCTVGATFASDPVVGVVSCLVAVLPCHGTSGYKGTVVHWNDEKCSSAEESMDALLAAASLALSEAEVLPE